MAKPLSTAGASSTAGLGLSMASSLSSGLWAASEVIEASVAEAIACSARMSCWVMSEWSNKCMAPRQSKMGWAQCKVLKRLRRQSVRPLRQTQLAVRRQAGRWLVPLGGPAMSWQANSSGFRLFNRIGDEATSGERCVLLGGWGHEVMTRRPAARKQSLGGQRIRRGIGMKQLPGAWRISQLRNSRRGL
ncbi:hypothetical protein D3C72_1613340 [compost metagenome]